MIASFSTSSPATSVALLADCGELLWLGEMEAPGRASECCAELLEAGLAETGRTLAEATLFVADTGPGSFTGVRVGVVMAKTLAWNFGTPCVGIDAFDLIDPARDVAVPARKGEFFVRSPGSEVIRTFQLAAGTVGYGFEGVKHYPKASAAAHLVACAVPISPFALVPKYLAEPSISTPKRPLSRISV